MPRRIIAFVVLAFAAATLFFRLGVWQLHRRTERRALNAVVETRLALPPADAFSLGGDTAVLRDRRAFAKGTLDYANEIVVGSRSNNGSPGVWVLTPLRSMGRDTALLVLRGWAYSPDAVTIDLSRWHDADSAFSGYLVPLAALPKRATIPAVMTGRTLRRLELAAVAPLIPYPIAPAYLVAVEDSVARRAGAPSAERLARIGMPEIDDGPHLSYAFQWFSFGTIAVVGAIIVALRSRRDSGS